MRILLINHRCTIGVTHHGNGSGTATEYHVGTTYRFTGYAAGYGQNSNEESTLRCEIEKLETISLSVKHTFYRSETSSLGAGHQNQLDTVYFMNGTGGEVCEDE